MEDWVEPQSSYKYVKVLGVTVEREVWEDYYEKHSAFALSTITYAFHRKRCPKNQLDKEGPDGCGCK
jgi:hypothetical protein